jgi:hypothetical protein
MHTVIDRIELKKSGQQTNPRKIPSKSLPLAAGIFSYGNSCVTSGYDFFSVKIPSYVLHGLLEREKG